MARLTLSPVPLAAIASSLVASGCPSQRTEGPPRAEALEVVSGAPGALGALAAGTDAAPPVVQPSPEEVLGGEEEPAPAGDAGIPDAAAEAPENVPL